MPATVTIELDAAQVMGDLLRQPGGLDLTDHALTGCPCSPEADTAVKATAEGVACQCGRLVARWTGAPGVSDLAMVDAPQPS